MKLKSKVAVLGFFALIIMLTSILMFTTSVQAKVMDDSEWSNGNWTPYSSNQAPSNDYVNQAPEPAPQAYQAPRYDDSMHNERLPERTVDNNGVHLYGNVGK